ncbi:hypothetical protein AB4144_07790, partial [Rhizobiaceae sp. 2RAB30]
RAVGATPHMAEAQGINVWAPTLGGVGLASAFSATSGALMVQSQGFADVNMGLGILINGLAALMIGEAIIGKQTVLRQLAAPFVGAVVYYQLVSLCLAAGMPPPDLKLATDLFIQLVEAKCGSYGLKLESPRDGNRRGSQVSFEHPHAYEVMQALIDRGVIGDFRAPSSMRFGFTPLYIGFKDVWRAVEILEEILRSEAWKDQRFAVRAAVT